MAGRNAPQPFHLEKPASIRGALGCSVQQKHDLPDKWYRCEYRWWHSGEINTPVSGLHDFHQAEVEDKGVAEDKVDHSAPQRWEVRTPNGVMMPDDGGKQLRAGTTSYFCICPLFTTCVLRSVAV